MEYTKEELDRTTGELMTVPLGNWVTVTEYGKEKGLGPRQIRSMLQHLGLLRDEHEEGTTGKTMVHRRRLTLEAIGDGLGKRIYPKKPGTYPFDVLSPKGQAWVDQRLAKAIHEIDGQMAADPDAMKAADHLQQFLDRRLKPEDFTAHMQVVWLLDVYPTLAQTQIQQITSVSAPLVSKYVAMRRDQRASWAALKLKSLRASPGVEHGLPKAA